MANYPYQYNQFTTPTNMAPMQMPQLFQPANGVFYLINSKAELNNVPVSNNITAAVCFNDGFLYLKTLQNGTPTTVSYKIISCEEEVTISDRFAKIEERLDLLEKNQIKKGGSLDVLL